MAKQYTLQELEHLLGFHRVTIKIMYTTKMMSQQQIARTLRLSRMHVGLFIKMKGLSRPKGSATHNMRKAKKKKHRMNYAFGALRGQDRYNFRKDLEEAVDRRKNKQ